MKAYKADKVWVRLFIVVGGISVLLIVASFVVHPKLAPGSIFWIVALIMGVWLVNHTIVTMTDDHIKIRTDPVCKGLTLYYKNIESVETKKKNKLLIFHLNTTTKPLNLSLAFLSAQDRADIIDRLQAVVNTKTIE